MNTFTQYPDGTKTINRRLVYLYYNISVFKRRKGCKDQRNNQKPFIEKGQTMPCPKERKKTTKTTNNDLQNTRKLKIDYPELH